MADRVADRISSELAFRPGVSMLMPYCPLPIGTGSDSALRSAYLGPCPHPLLAKAAVAMVFTKHGVNAAEIRNSSIPFRS